MTVKTLVVGVGNPTRSDDGAGLAVAERIAALDLPDVEVRTTQQLQVELAEDFPRFDQVIVVDTAMGGDAVQLHRIRADDAQEPKGSRGRESAHPSFRGEETRASHHLSPAVLLALTDTLHGRAPELLLCTLRGERFDFGTSLSPAVQAQVNEAVRRIAGWLRGSNLDETC
jgi:hydrogenase maturation protease